jgi:putative hemolysin
VNNRPGYGIKLILIGLLLAGCSAPTGAPAPTEVPPTEAPVATEAPRQEIANPASENCVKQGGTLAIEERGDGGQIGVCYFEDNRQCEEWALLRGECPVGGVKVTGYVTPAGRYCAITGGTYAITGEDNTDNEQGTCTFKDGSQCDTWAYYTGGCTPGTAAGPAAPAGEWQTYTNAEVGFSLQVPSTWSQATLPDQNEGAIHGEGFTGPEGGVEVYWGVGFGGACPTGTEPVQLAQGEAAACHATQSDGTEVWSQIGYEVSGSNSFSVRAYTSDAQPSSHDLVLQVLSTLTFMPPAPSPAPTNAAGSAIQPLPMEVCDGQAQAMVHTLEVLAGTGSEAPLVATQSEAPLDDFVNNATGTGCQGTVTGTGVQFESPDAVVNALGGMLADQGWTEDPMLAAGGPTGMGAGYRKGDQICTATAMWEPDDSANCPKDQPVSACQVTPEQQVYTVTLNCGVETPEG